jgi:nucleoside-diphosphate-sugar epimerase
MPRILILGATGYLGNRIATLLVQSGQHTVYGVARTREKALQLAQEEIRPVLCPDPVNSPEAYLSAIRSFHIDIVVDVAGANQESSRFLDSVRKVGQEQLDDYRGRGVKGPKLGFIYCSGTWVHGSSDKAVTDLDVVGSGAETPPLDLVAWRAELENEILKSDNILDVLILRPALIYGRKLSIWSSFVTPILEAGRHKSTGPIDIPLDAGSRPGLIHVDDAATAFERAIEKLPLLAGTGVYPVFDLVTSQESMREIFDVLAACWGCDATVQLSGHAGNPFAEAMSASFRGSSARAELLLGWQPRRLGGFVKDMDLYAAAFAAQSGSSVDQF